jgi:hypothetical protein
LIERGRKWRKKTGNERLETKVPIEEAWKYFRIKVEKIQEENVLK